MIKIKEIFSSIASRYDLANSVLSLGFHRFWRRHSLRKISIPENPVILDLCCGTGDWTNEIASRYPDSTLLIGLDFCIPMLNVAKSGPYSSRNKVSGKHYICGNAEQLPFPNCSFDLITVGFGIRNIENVQICLGECLRVLKPCGVLLILEFGQPDNLFWSVIFDYYSRWLLPLIGGLLTGNRSAYEHLYHSSRNFPCGNKFAEILKSNGFEIEKFWSYMNGVVYAYSARKSA